MKQEHQELLINLLLEKIESLELQLSVLKLPKSNPSYNFKRFDGPISEPSDVQEAINAYEERIEELIQQCNELHKNGQTSEEKLSYNLLEMKYNQLHLSYANICNDKKKYECTIEKLTEDLDKALKNKDSRKDAGPLTTYKLMVDYAKSQGFKFLRAEKMKDAIEESKNMVVKKDIVQDTQSCVSEKKTEVKDYEEFGFDNKHHADCPHGVEDRKGHVAVLAGIYCRTKCPYCAGADFDQLVIHCDKKK